MCKQISKLSAPALAGVVREKTVKSAMAEIKNCIYDGADFIDLHISSLEQINNDTLREIIESSKVPILALNYNFNVLGEEIGLTEEERVNSLFCAVEAGAAGVDIQGYTFHLPSKQGFCGEDKYSFTKENPKEIVTDTAIISKQCEFIERVHDKGAEVLLSCHPGIFMTHEQVVELALFLEKRNPDIIKIVTTAESEDDVIESFKTMKLLRKEVKTPVSYHTNGKTATLSRIVNPILGGHIVFCVDRYAAGSTMEQLDLRTARTIIDAVRKIY